ncbi:NADH dehydrogenase [ubiquinone] 1 beta subcomplex subunit 1-like [Peromyscus eremicus]|uniref:NADH dehydrogenase [ubiquinone] 1 beta subcomplex subunit 1-like n=1 Tax=Peromyscus eremicus TaxID=42410 RepID=UPI0027DE3C46|nr:NADH dehydrogenase [ubiquinone] 1 beta subcomplex subunit 1-like [Peromyscus eremicus]
MVAGCECDLFAHWGLTCRRACHQAAAITMFQLICDYWVHVLAPMRFVFGCYLDKRNDEKLTAFRNKSMLFRRELRPNEEVTWK